MYPSYQELPTILTKERVIPVYQELQRRGNRIRDLEKDVEQRQQAAAHVEKMALQALQFGNNHDAVREVLRDIVTRARRESK